MRFRNYEDITAVVSKYLHLKKDEEYLVHLKRMNKFIKFIVILLSLKTLAPIIF